MLQHPDQIPGQYGGLTHLSGRLLPKESVKKDSCRSNAFCGQGGAGIFLLYQERRQDSGQHVAASGGGKRAASRGIDKKSSLRGSDNGTRIFQDTDRMKFFREIQRRCGKVLL